MRMTKREEGQEEGKVEVHRDEMFSSKSTSSVIFHCMYWTDQRHSIPVFFFF